MMVVGSVVCVYVVVSLLDKCCIRFANNEGPVLWQRGHSECTALKTIKRLGKVPTAQTASAAMIIRPESTCARCEENPLVEKTGTPKMLVFFFRFLNPV